jgi:micrococcal nuclease
MVHGVILSLLLAAAATQTAQVVSVHDGDTITVRIDGRSEKIRLVGIDSPELDDERPEFRRVAYEARDYARSQLAGETITLESEPRQKDRDRYGRLLRYVILEDGTNFDESLVRKGYAHVFDRFQFAQKQRFKAAESAAKREGLGIWTLPPGPWRMTPEAR